MPAKMFFRLFSRKKYFTFRHFSRTSSYTHKHRQRMANYRKQYLDHVERWLNYEEESSTPPTGEEGKESPVKKSLPPKSHKRVDSFVDEARRDIARDVAKENQLNGAARSKCVADQGKVSCLPIVLPLPSMREEGSEGWATDEATLDFIEEQNQGETVTQKIKSLLGLS